MSVIGLQGPRKAWIGKKKTEWAKHKTPRGGSRKKSTKGKELIQDNSQVGQPSPTKGRKPGGKSTMEPEKTRDPIWTKRKVRTLVFGKSTTKKNKIRRKRGRRKTRANGGGGEWGTAFWVPTRGRFKTLNEEKEARNSRGNDPGVSQAGL